MRTHKKAVVFSKPFFLSAFEQELPAGVYDVEIDEEPLPGLSFQAFRRTACRLSVPESVAGAGMSHTLSLAPHEFDLINSGNENASKVLSNPDKTEIARAEEEGMTII